MSEKHVAEPRPDGGLRLGEREAAALERGELPGARAPVEPRPKRPRETGGPEKRGFDPYNSGAFDRGRAWSRIGKR
jgi:hypothetical protein